MTGKGTDPTATTMELSPLGERLAGMFLLRACFAIAMFAVALFAPTIVGPSTTQLVVITAIYLGATAAIEGIRRIRGSRGLFLVAFMLLIDGVYLAWVMYATGGPSSPLRSLVYLHLIAVTLLASYRTGLKIALWHSLLFFVAFYAQLAELVEPFIPIDGSPQEAARQFNRTSMLNVLAFWVVALGTAAFSALNERELRRGKAHMFEIAQMSAELDEARTAQSVGKMLIDRACSALNVSRAVVIAAGEQSGKLCLLGSAGDIDPDLFKAHEDEVVVKTWHEHAGVAVKKLDPVTDPMVSGLLPDARNLVIVPMYAGTRPVGVLVVEQRTEAIGVQRRVVTLLEQFASHAALALRNVWLMDEIIKLADTDALTGIANRRVFERTLQKEVMRSRRTGDHLSLLMIDIDHFKDLNDTYGHQKGDEVLKEVAHSLATNARTFDTPARYGGEEFAIILPSCNAQESIWIAERMRQILGTQMSGISITVSAGVATYPAHASTATELLGAADEALYESKRAGRNRVSRSRRELRSDETEELSPHIAD